MSLSGRPGEVWKELTKKRLIAQSLFFMELAFAWECGWAFSLAYA